jgi:hypothetical protein
MPLQNSLGVLSPSETDMPTPYSAMPLENFALSHDGRPTQLELLIVGLMRSPGHFPAHALQPMAYVLAPTDPPAPHLG